MVYEIGVLSELFRYSEGFNLALGIGIGKLTLVGVILGVVRGSPEHKHAVPAGIIFERIAGVCNQLILQPGIGLGKIEIVVVLGISVGVRFGSLLIG